MKLYEESYLDEISPLNRQYYRVLFQAVFDFQSVIAPKVLTVLVDNSD
jgi:hypothetical protein